MLTAVSLFAGVGGIDLALERAGVTVNAAVEIDNAARGVLADRLPHTTLFPDVTEVTADDLLGAGFVPDRGILAAGWPCQGNSVAGRRGGMADPRSGLWRHVVRLLAETRAKWFLGENVPGLLSVNGGDDFRTVIGDLAALGYGGTCRVLDAQHFGVPQRRRRVFFVGCLGDARRPVEVLLEPEGRAGHPAARVPSGQDAAGAAGYGVAVAGEPGGVANTLTARDARGPLPDRSLGTVVISAAKTAATLTSGGHPNSNAPSRRQEDDVNLVAFSHTAGKDLQIGAVSPTIKAGHDAMPSIVSDARVRRLTPTECERLQGFPDNWTITSNGKPQSDSARYRQMGNAVAVPCVQWIVRRLVATESETKERAA